VLRDRDGLAWIGLYRPDVAEIRSVATEFELHELPVQDAISAHQRPQLERYGPTLFVVLLPARYLDDVERVGCGELHLFVGVNFVITIPGGHRVPAGHPPVAGHVGRVWNAGSTSTVATSSCAVTCGTWPTTSHGWWNGGCVPGVAAERADGDRRAGRATAGRGDADVDRGQPGAERGGQRNLRVGGHAVAPTLIGTITA
jgi:hypothetical protein